MFPGSQGNTQDSRDGNGGHNGHSGFHGGSIGFGQTMKGATTSTFNIGIKPKGLPSFHDRANEDVSTWVSKVTNFLYLTGTNPCQ